MTSDPPGKEVWRLGRKQSAVAVIGVVVVLAGLLLTMPEDKERPLRPTTVSRPSETPTAAEGTSPPGALAQAVSRPAEGRFVYHRTVRSNGERTEEDTSWIVTHLDGERFEQTSAVGRDGDPDAKSTTFTIEWSAEGVARLAREFPTLQRGERGRCELEPPLLIQPLPLEVGLTWESASDCGEGPRRRTEEFSGKVLRTERTEVAGMEFETFVIETSSGAGQRGLFWFTSDTTEWFSPELGMTVRSTAVSRETETGSWPRQEITTELLTWPGSPSG